jgi:serine kinase
MELAGHGDLLEYVRLFGCLNEDKAKLLFRQIVDAVSYCHSLDIMHR